MRKLCGRCGKAQAVRPGGLCNRCFGQRDNKDNSTVDNLQLIPCDKIRRDGGTQARTSICEETVQEYADLLDAEPPTKFPPLIVFRDDAGDYWLADGFHRLLAHLRRSCSRRAFCVKCEQAHARTALWYAIGANRSHGLKRTNADKRKAVEMALAHPNGTKLSDRQIAEHCGVGRDLVGEVRQARLSDSDSQSSMRTGADGRTTNTANIGKRPKVAAASAAKDPADTAEVASSLPSAAQAQPPARVLDGKGIPIPEELVDVFVAREKFDEALSLARKLARLINEIADGTGGDVYRRWLRHLAAPTDDDPDRNRHICTDLRKCVSRLEYGRPYCCVCPYCNFGGDVDPECGCCHGLGWVTKEAFRSLPPEYLAKVESLADTSADKAA